MTIRVQILQINVVLWLSTKMNDENSHAKLCENYNYDLDIDFHSEQQLSKLHF